MIPTEIRNCVQTLQAQGRSVREISRLLKLSRNTLARPLAATKGERGPPPRPADCICEDNILNLTWR